MLKGVTIFLIVLFFLSPCIAQQREIASLEFGSIPAVAFKNPSSASSTDSIGLHFMKVRLTLPRILSKKGERLTVLTPGVGFQGFWADSESSQNDPEYFSLQFSLNLFQMLSGGWGINVFNNISLDSDFERVEKVSVRDTSFSGGFLFMRFLSRRFNMGFGFGYVSLTGDKMISPLFMCNWRLHSKWQLNMVLPSMLQLIWITSSRIQIGARLSMEGNQFNLTEEGVVYHGLLKRSSVQAGLFFKYRIRGAFFSTFFFGRTLRRRYEMYDSSDTRIWNNSLSNGWVFRFKLSLDFS